MNFKNVWETLKNSGGASYNLMTSELNPSIGYMVALSNHEQIFPIPETYDEFKNYVRVFLFYHDNFDMIVDSENLFIGFWKHNNALYIDLTENIKDFIQAYEKGFNSEQISIWDCAKKKEIEIVYMYPY